MDLAEKIAKNYTQAVSGLKAEWLKTASDHWYRYVTDLPQPLKTVYLVHVLHGQINNGGLHQYFTNGYGQFAKETINALTRIGAFKRAQSIKKSYELVNAQRHPEEMFRKKLLAKDIKELFISDELFDPLDKLDQIYYSIEDEDIELFLGRYLVNAD